VIDVQRVGDPFGTADMNSVEAKGEKGDEETHYH
jgi:hypothetical protein